MVALTSTVPIQWEKTSRTSYCHQYAHFAEIPWKWSCCLWSETATKSPTGCSFGDPAAADCKSVIDEVYYFLQFVIAILMYGLKLSQAYLLVVAVLRSGL
ncbi:uncharacterized protein CANTADRAFT_229405 [Suhomyces tanzawaensis NRRL Y-17324]|uniref:Uncharacterized protein n=1 Tax=Suhomyces tanzawaensis NRRL Y-17324 TaxID=984487 RepID=A0A1E4SL11_9ASCO|nr:uncharacterized protein CANTADRAFT_229405 [Suhomyces tanzawaensis NRRL Y-17324]ODV80189.1 hypothetical protein CANTADRAFT_229405 [Suhomyces tanzawaensis NRRL Y-17324]